MKKVATEGNTFLLFHQVPVVRNGGQHYPLAVTIGFPTTYLMDTDLSAGYTQLLNIWGQHGCHDVS